MPRDRFLLTEIFEAGDRIIDLVAGRDAADFKANRDLRDALLWNFTVLGEASSQVSQDLKDAHPEVGWSNPRADAQPDRPRLLVGRARHPTSTATEDLPDLLVAMRRIATAL